MLWQGLSFEPFAGLLMEVLAKTRAGLVVGPRLQEGLCQVEDGLVDLGMLRMTVDKGLELLDGQLPTLPCIVPRRHGKLVVFLTGMFLNAAIIGILVLALVLRFGHRAEVAAWAFAYLLFLLCGLYYPVTILPAGFRTMAQLVPLTHFLDYFRHFYGFPLLSPYPLLLGFLQSVIYLAASYLLLKFTLQSALKRGILLKLSE